MSPRDVVEYFGGYKKAAVALGIKQPSVSAWMRRGVVPPVRQHQIETATNGALKADKPALRESVSA